MDISLEYWLWNQTVVSLPYRSILGICNRCEAETIFLLKRITRSLTLAGSGAQVFLCPGCWSSAWCPGGFGFVFPSWFMQLLLSHLEAVSLSLYPRDTLLHTQGTLTRLAAMTTLDRALSLTIPKHGTTRTHRKHKHR